MDTYVVAGSSRLLVNVTDAQEMLGGISRAYLYRLLDSGRLASVKLGKRRMIPVGSIEAFAASLPAADDVRAA